MEQLASAWVARLSVHSLVTVVDLTHATLLHQANYALSGTFHPLSKLIICVVMLRGRHRGLPVALDRAIMLPRELDPESEDLDMNPQDRVHSIIKTLRTHMVHQSQIQRIV